MRVESVVTSISWIPYEAISGHMKLPFALKMTHYDPPPPDRLADPTDVDGLRDEDRFRFANVLSAWAEFGADGQVRMAAYTGGGRIGATNVKVGPGTVRFAATPFDDITVEPEVGDGWVRFVQTAGGRTGAPMPRTVKRPPYVQVVAPTAWTTLSLTLHADGRSEFALVGASPFPRHWVYGPDGSLARKTGFIDFKTWASEDFGEHSPWGGVDREVRAVPAESEVEREVSAAIMSGGAKPPITRLCAGDVLLEQGSSGDEVFLLLDGMVSVEVDGEPVAEVGPGAILGEQAVVGDGVRGATVRALTPAKVVAAHGGSLDLDRLSAIAAGRSEHGDAVGRVTPDLRLVLDVAVDSTQVG